jgi:DNA-binding IclR family transcriptional regulator
MPRTRLEDYVAIIGALAARSPQTLMDLAAEVHLDKGTLQRYLTFLAGQGAIAEQPTKTRQYTINVCGAKIVKFFTSPPNSPKQP